MAKTGHANLPLHPGRAPRWLFKRMVKLSKGIIEVLSYEYGKEEFLRRISDPFWFQAFSCVLGFDWHSSGTTTVTCGALKEAINPEEYGLAIAGGKGKASRGTPQDLEDIGEIFNFSTDKIENLKYSSRLAAKVDNSAIQDHHQLYHHVFLLSEGGSWTVIQQGMNSENNYARRYHWLSENLKGFLQDPHDAIIGEKNFDSVLNMSSKESKSNRDTCVDLVNDNPQHLKRDWARLNKPKAQKTLDDWNSGEETVFPVENLDMPRVINWKKLKQGYEFQPKNYEKLLSIKGVGPSTVRALALISDLLYGDKPSWEDPVKYSFTVGGKDGVPFPVDKKVMDETTDVIKSGVEEAKIGKKEKLRALQRLKKYVPESLS